jgi:hypothetical protein
MGYYWLPYFDNYVKRRNIYDAKIYEYNNNKIIIIPNNKELPLVSNIFRIKDNKAYQYYSLSSDKITIDNIIYSINIYDTYILVNNQKYNLIQFDINNLTFYPISHTIKIKEYKEINNNYQISLYSDVFNEYVKNIPLIYVNKDDINKKLSIYEGIYRYLEKNKFIGLVKF